MSPPIQPPQGDSPLSPDEQTEQTKVTPEELDRLEQFAEAHAAATQACEARGLPIDLSGWATDPDQLREQKARMHLETARQQIELDHNVEIKVTVPEGTPLPSLGEVDRIIRKLERAGIEAHRAAVRRQRRHLEREAQSEQHPVGYAADCARELADLRQYERAALSSRAQVPVVAVKSATVRPAARSRERHPVTRRRSASPSASDDPDLGEPPAAPPWRRYVVDSRYLVVGVVA